MGRAASTAASDLTQTRYELRGKHQSGILTPAQQQMFLIAFDLIAETREGVIALLKKWTLAAERMMTGEMVNETKVYRDVPPDDTGEAMDSGSSALTVTFAFGAGFFKDTEGRDRYGIASHLPKVLTVGIPRMAAEKIDPDKSYGDVLIQVCAEDPMVSLHAVHNLTRIAFGSARVRWSQLGYGRTSSTSTTQTTPRNLFGFKDGTSNIKAEEPEAELNEHLWIQPEDDFGDVFAGGSCFCMRKIHQMMEVWDEISLSEQEVITGRDKVEGAPLSGGTEFTEPDFSARDEDGNLMIAPDSHVATVHPDNNGGRRMLRRGYNYIEGNNELGRLVGGLVFIAFVRNPETNFIPILAKMSTDQMTEYLQHQATGLWIVPPGITGTQEYIGQQLFEA